LGKNGRPRSCGHRVCVPKKIIEDISKSVRRGGGPSIKSVRKGVTKKRVFALKNKINEGGTIVNLGHCP